MITFSISIPSLDEILENHFYAEKPLPTEMQVEVGVFKTEPGETTYWKTLGTIMVPFELIEKGESASLAGEDYPPLNEYLWNNLKFVKWQ